MDLEEIKELIANDDLRIRLHDFIGGNIQKIITELNGDNFSVNTEFSDEEFEKRVKKIEELTSNLCSVQILLSYWGTEEQRQNNLLAFNRIANDYRGTSGNVVWIVLKWWYPVLLLLYYGGISAVACGNYKKLFDMFNEDVNSPNYPRTKISLIQATTTAFSKLNGDPFKIILGDRNHLVPRNEYLFETLKPKIDDLLFFGTEYETIFDRFEVLVALEYAHQTSGESPDRVRGPIGRFGYKFYYESPLNQIIEEADTLKNSWPPIKGGLFGSNYQRFKLISEKLQERGQGLGWH